MSSELSKKGLAEEDAGVDRLSYAGEIIEKRMS
jgi:hypothetical protein